MISVFIRFFSKISFLALIMSPFLQAYTVVTRSDGGSIDFHCVSKSTGALFCSVSRQCAPEDKEVLFASLKAEASELLVEPIAKAVINFGKEEIEHPFKACDVQTFALMSKDETLGMQSRIELPVFVTKQEPNHVYMFESLSKSCSTLLKSPSIVTAVGTEQKEGSVIKLETAEGYIFALVSPKEGVFGDIGSNLTVLIRGFDKERDEKGEVKDNARQLRVFTTLSAFPIEKESAFLSINHAVEKIGSVVDMYWDPILQCLYVGLDVKTGDSPDSGGYCVAVGRFKPVKIINNDKEITMRTLMLSPIVSESALHKNKNCVVGTIKKGCNLSAQHVRTLHTTGGISYLLVHGGNGDRNETCCSVYAFPVINSGDTNLQGSIASVKAVAKNVYRPLQGTIQAISGRTISQPAIHPDEMPDVEQEAVVVGGGDLSEPIEEIFSQGEAVFARTHSGVFHSQALLNEYGIVKGWSCWQKIMSVGRAEELSAAWLNTNDGSWTYVVKTPFDEQIRRSTWQHDAHKEDVCDMIEYTQQMFKHNNKKVSCVRSIVLPDNDTDQKSLIIVGDDTIAIFDENGAEKVDFSNGTRSRLQEILDSGAGTYLVEKYFKDIAPIVSVEFVDDRNGKGSIVLVGGHGGLMALSQEKLFDSRNNSCAEKVGDYKQVKKIITCGSSVYILTRDRLDRIDLSEKSFQQAIKSPHTMASKDGLSLGAYGCFYDCVISGPLALLATSHGLYQVAEGRSIVNAKSPADCAWKRIHIPEGLDPVIKIVVATKTGREQDLTAGAGGHIYVLSAYAGKHQAFINRFSVPGCQEVAQEVVPFFDHYIESVPRSHFLNFSSYKQDFFTDGAMYFSVGSDEGFNSRKRQLFVIPAFVEPHLGARMSGARSKPILEVQDCQGLSAKVTRLGPNGRLTFIAGGELIVQH